MNQTNVADQLTDKIVKVLDKNQVCSFATIEGNKPHVRYMKLFHDGVAIMLVTDRKTHKVEELQENPNVFIITGFDGDWGSETVQIEGKAEVSGDNALRQALWKDTFSKWFKGPDDPDYVIITIKPQRMIYTDGKTMKDEVWQA